MKNEIGTFSFDVAKRILDKLCDTDLNRTNLASSSRINYNALIRYLGILSALGWIRMTEQGEVAITASGREARKRLITYPAETNEQGSDSNRSVTSSEIGGGKEENSVVNPGHIQDLLLSYEQGKAHQNLQGLTNGSRSRSSSSRSRPHIHKVMIVDDEPEVGLTFKMFLKSTGRYETEVFTESSLALKNFANNPGYYDLVVLDIRMEGINGLRLYQSMNAINPNCRFLFVSALDATDELLSIFPGISPHNIIKKPVTKDKFIRAAERLFKHG